MIGWLVRLLFGESKIMDMLNQILAEQAALQTSMDAVKSAVEALVASQAGMVSSAQLQPVLDTATSQKAEMDALLVEMNPPAPAPAPAPVSEEEPAAE